MRVLANGAIVLNTGRVLGPHELVPASILIEVVNDMIPPARFSYGGGRRGIVVSDEGVSLGNVQQINFVGDGVVASLSGDQANVSIVGSTSFMIFGFAGNTVSGAGTVNLEADPFGVSATAFPDQSQRLPLPRSGTFVNFRGNMISNTLNGGLRTFVAINGTNQGASLIWNSTETGVRTQTLAVVAVAGDEFSFHIDASGVTSGTAVLSVSVDYQ